MTADSDEIRLVAVAGGSNPATDEGERRKTLHRRSTLNHILFPF
jgi:hypothetical protein